jgi:hypothetical protein
VYAVWAYGAWRAPLIFVVRRYPSHAGCRPRERHPPGKREMSNDVISHRTSLFGLARPARRPRGAVWDRMRGHAASVSPSDGTRSTKALTKRIAGQRCLLAGACGVLACYMVSGCAVRRILSSASGGARGSAAAIRALLSGRRGGAGRTVGCARVWRRSGPSNDAEERVPLHGRVGRVRVRLEEADATDRRLVVWVAQVVHRVVGRGGLCSTRTGGTSHHITSHMNRGHRPQ